MTRNVIKPKTPWIEMTKKKIFEGRNDISTKYPKVEMTFGEMS